MKDRGMKEENLTLDSKKNSEDQLRLTSNTTFFVTLLF
jgi:hypothetical protein